MRIGVTAILAVGAFVTYGANAHIQRKVRIGEATSAVLGILRGRWDEIRTDETLCEIFSGEKKELTPKEREKLRYFLYTLFDTYDYAIHLIYHGYFDYADELAGHYRNMIDKTLSKPFVIEIWEEQDSNAKFIFQNEYTPQLRKVIDILIAERRETAVGQ